MTRFEQQRTTPGNVSRRGLLGAATLGAGGLVMMQAGAAAEWKDAGKPGEGGYGRNSVQLPPGAKVAVHDAKDIEAMPEFKYSLDGGVPKITSGGWAKESTIHQLPVSKGLAGVHMFLNPGASRELHWHAIAAE
jgi:oxalate decarboxylase